MYEEEKVEVTAADLNNISALAARQLEAEKAVADAELVLKRVKEDLRRVQEIDLPLAMAQAGCKSFTTPAGRSVTIKDGLTASVSAERKPAVCQWLRQNGFGDLVSEEVTLTFGKGQEAEAKKAVAELFELGYVPNCNTQVNTASLKSLVAEQLGEGNEVPLTLLGVVQYKKAVIK